jgi:hypothetical protein
MRLFALPSALVGVSAVLLTQAASAQETAPAQQGPPAAIRQATLPIRPEAARPTATDARNPTTALLERDQAVEFRSFDPVSRRLTVRTADGQDWAVVIDRTANLVFGAVAPGESVLLSWRFNRQGQPEVVMRPAPQKAPAAALGRPVDAERKAYVWMRGPLKVLAVDTAAGALTVRSERVEPETLSVDDSAARALDTLAPGDLVILSLHGDRVTTITRRPPEGRVMARSARR